MNVEFAPRATRDLQEIGLYYRTVAGEATAMAVARRIEHVINLVARQPMIAPLISRRDNVRVALILRYPSRIFYRVREDTVQILHVRHTARRPWGLET
jgi:plasmid stabilization system protein ParE